MKQQKRHENLTYLALWGLLFTVPVLSLYLRSVNNPMMAFQWSEVFMIWKQFGIFLALFLIHNFLMAPLLVYEHKRGLYFSIATVMVGCFFVFQCTSRPPEPKDMRHAPPPFEQAGEGRLRERSYDMEEHRRHLDPDKEQMPPIVVGEHDVVALIILILMLGMNIGIKGYFKARHDTKRFMALEKENLEQQLEYLRYQINPHFFMNTLNNIHALVDIDPEKAKDTILELSKMMRFVLYEGNKKGVPLTREFDFIRHYITLMRLRYTDKVEVKVELPTETPDYEIPPLMLITFIENAFKHGISYQHQSFIHVKVGIEGTKLRFCCRNSKAEKTQEEKLWAGDDKNGGVGLANVKQRLNLIYGENYTLKIQDEADAYDVKLEIPLV